MARKTTPTGPKIATLDGPEIKAGIDRLSKRLAELEAFNVDGMASGHPPELHALETAIARSVEKTFGAGTTDGNRYRAASDLAYHSMIMFGDGPSLYDYRQATKGNIETSKALLRQAIQSLEEDFEELRPISSPVPETKSVRPPTRRVFVVHGHDEGAREAVARFLEKIGFEAIILHEKASSGNTIVEKVEAHSEVDFAVVLLTPDDVGGKDASSLQPRARQNVLVELGYFIGKLGRQHVCALRKGDVEIPSDFSGVVYVPLDGPGAWKQGLARELDGAGHEIDWNVVMRA